MSPYRSPWFWLTLLGIGLFVFALGVITVGDAALSPAQEVLFTSPSGETMYGSYTPGRLEVGVMILEGFGSDQVMMRSAANEFARMGAHVFTFDFSSHGRSPGTLGFDNAQTDRLAYQALAAKEEFKRLSGLPDAQIVVVGHSLGARTALQAATMDPQRVAGLVLIGVQVNLVTNLQAEVFTGTSDASLPWVQALSPLNPPVDILILSGDWDDILTPTAARLLLAKLSGVPDAEQGQAYAAQLGASRRWVLFPNLLHNYEIFSPRVLVEAKSVVWAVWGNMDIENNRILSLPLPAEAADATVAQTRIWMWLLGLGGIFLALYAAPRWLATGNAILQPRLEMTHPKRFLWMKLLLWLASLPLAALLMGASFLLPLGNPAMNMIYVAFLGGYGLLQALLYWRGKMPGVRGQLPFEEARRFSLPRLAAGLAAGALLLLAAALFTRSGLFMVPPVGDRLIWVALFTPITALGFWIGLNERALLDQAAPGRRALAILHTLAGLVPFFLYTLAMAFLGSYSGMISGLQGLVVLAYVLSGGKIVQWAGRSPWLTAFVQAVILYCLILPNGVLFK